MAPRALQNARHTCEVNRGPLSDTMSAGMTCRQKTCLTRRSAVSLEEGSLGRVGGLRETVYHGKDGGIAFRRGKTVDEVESNV